MLELIEKLDYLETQNFTQKVEEYSKIVKSEFELKDKLYKVIYNKY